MNLDSFAVDAMALTTLTKVLVDMTKLSGIKSPKWLWPALALIYAIISSMLLLVSSSNPITPQAVAISLIKAIVSAGAAIGVTELQKAA